MRNLEAVAMLDNIRTIATDEDGGAYAVRMGKTILRVIASHGMGWDHVSVSLQHRCPTWEEMEYVKRLFFKNDELAMQLHVTPDQHINNHPFCLHMWRPHDKEIPLPPAIMV
jgi:hypothetical protein